MGKNVYIVNVIGTSGEKPKDFDSKSEANNWLEYWEEVKGEELFPLCANSICDAEINDDYETVGAHVYICSTIFGLPNDLYSPGKEIFIAPLCRACNGKRGYSSIGIVSSEDLMIIDEDYLVLHPKYKKKK